MLLFLSISLWPAYCAAALIPASVLQRPQYGNDLKASDLPLSNTSVFANNRSSSLGGIGGVLKIACNSDMYGKNLKVKSCQRLFGYISKDTRQYTFADRESRVPFDIALPMRTYSDDGLCFVQPVLDQDATTGHASLEEIGGAAWTMVDACVVKRGKGGLAYNLGGDNKMSVVIAGYKPDVACETSKVDAPNWDSCVQVFTRMSASKRLRLFGSSEEEDVEEELPLVLEAEDGKCQVVIDIKGQDTVSSWYEIWEATTAMTTMCTRAKSRGGKAKGIGKARNIFLELSTVRTYPRVSTAAASNTLSSSGNAGLLDSSTASAKVNDWSFDRKIPFQLVNHVPDVVDQLVTTDTGTLVNNSQIAVS